MSPDRELFEAIMAMVRAAALERRVRRELADAEARALVQHFKRGNPRRVTS